MSKISHFAADHPAVVSILLITCLVFGIISLQGMTTSLIADLSLPQIYIISIYPGASPEDVENDVSKVIEDDLSTVPGLKSITSESGGSLSIVNLIFQDNIDPADKIADIRYRLDRLKDDLPEGLQGEPWAIIGDSSMLSVMAFSVANEDTQKTYDYLNDKIIPRITQIPGVSGVSVIPNSEKTVKIKLRLDDLADKEISPITVYQLLSANNSSYPLGDTSFKERGVSFRYDGAFKSLDDINVLPVGKTDDNVIIHLSDVADVIYESPDKVENVIVNGRPAYYVEIQKRSEGDVTTICNEVKNILNEIDRETDGALHPEIHQDDSRTTNLAIAEVVRSGVLGAIMAVIAIWLLLADPKATLIIGLTIPLCILLSFIFLSLAGRNMNMMTISGLVVALGMVVDGSIVMLEQVYRYIGTGKYMTRQAIFRGSDEVASSILGSVLTTVVVFIPIVLLQGIVGKILSDVALTLMFSMIASLIVSVLVIPFLIKVLRHDGDPVPQHRLVNAFFKKLENGYKHILNWSIENKKYVLLVSVVLLILSAFMIPYLGVTFLPSVDQGNFYINCTFPYTYTEEDTHREAKIIEDYLTANYSDILDNYIATITTSADVLSQGARNELQFHVAITPISEGRKTRIHKYIPEIQSDLSRLLPDADVKVSNGGFDKLLGYVSDGGGWGLTLSGDDMDVLYETAEQLKEHLEKHPEVTLASLSTTYDNRDVTFNLDHAISSGLGVTALESGLTSVLLFRDTDCGRFRDESTGERYKMSITSDASDKPLTPDMLSKMRVKSLTGEMISFDNIGSLNEEKTLTYINRKDRSRTISVNATLLTSNTANVSNYMSEYIKNNPLPAGVKADNGGLMELIDDSMGPLMKAALIAIFLVYVVMVVQFERYRQPFLIMGCVPFSLIGIIVALLVFGTDLSIVVVLALVALSGTVVNNGIILIDYTNSERYKRRECKAKGIDEKVLEEADCDITGAEYRDVFLDKEWELKTLRDMVVNSAASRIRPILMTVVTTMLGVIPMAFSHGDGAELMAPLGQSMFFGLFISTIVALLVIPILYYITEAHSIKKHTKKGDKMKRKHVFLASISIITAVILASSCSYNFDAGISGSVYEANDTTVYPNVYVYAYTSEEERDKDYDAWLEVQKEAKYGGVDAEGYPITDVAKFTPNPDFNVFQTQTLTDGSFTVSRIVWNTGSPKWGRDYDKTKIYLMYYNKDATLLKDENVYSIVSGGANSATIRANLKRQFTTFPGISGYVRDNTSNTPQEKGSKDDDSRNLELYVKTGNTDGYKGVFTDLKKESGKRSTSSAEVSYSDTYNYTTHGNYANLGSGVRMRLIYDEGSNEGYIWYYIKDTTGSTPTSKEEMYKKTYTKKFKYSTNASSTSATVDFERQATAGDRQLFATAQDE